MASAQPAWAAADGGSLAALQWGAEIASLASAAVLLAYVFAMAKVADGSAMAENINLVAAAAICLAASVLATWGARFMPDALTEDQSRLASQLLIIVAMVLFTLYIARVRRALLRFLNAATHAEEMLAAVQVPDIEPVPDTGPELAGETDLAEEA
jgi:hypothetical protein